jgi:hypothetical protein
MIQKVDLEDSSGIGNAAGQARIGFRGAWVTGGTIIHQDKSVSGMRNGSFENFAWVSNRLIQNADRDLNLSIKRKRVSMRATARTSRSAWNKLESDKDSALCRIRHKPFLPPTF